MRTTSPLPRGWYPDMKTHHLSLKVPGKYKEYPDRKLRRLFAQETSKHFQLQRELALAEKRFRSLESRWAASRREIRLLREEVGRRKAEHCECLRIKDSSSSLIASATCLATNYGFDFTPNGLYSLECYKCRLSKDTRVKKALAAQLEGKVEKLEE